MSELNKVTDAMSLTINDSELQKVTTDIAEAIGDSLLDDGILKEIPIIGTLVGFTKGALNIRDKLFLKKIIYFLSQLSDIPLAQRQKQIQKIENSKEYKTKVSEKLLYIIERAEDAQKAEIIGKLFTAFLREEISYEYFLKCTNAIQNLFISDIVDFLKEKKERMEIEIASAYISVGLMRIMFVPPKLNEFSNMFFSNAMDGEPPVEYNLEPGVTYAMITPIGIALRKVFAIKDNSK